MYKRLLAVLISIVLVTVPITSFTVGDASEDYTSCYETLKGLDIICGYTEFDFGAAMQRYEFINMIANFYGETKYTEVQSDAAIETAFAHGLINSVEAFRPYDDILYEEAIKVVVCALGYNELAQLQGGWPLGYMKVANRIDILDGVEGSADMPMTKGNLVTLLYNALDEPVMERIVYGEDFADYEAEEGVTLLSVYRDIYEVRGRFDGTEYTMLYGLSSLNDGDVSIGGEIYSYGKPVPDEYLGSEVEAYVRKGDFKSELYYMTKAYEDDTIEISAENMISVNSEITELEYYDESGLAETAKISKSAYVICNGEFYADYTAEDFAVSDGYIMLTDSNDDRVYDVVKITEYENMYVSNVMVSAKTVSGKFDYDGALNILKLNDTTEDIKVRYFDSEMNPASFDALAPKQILSVAQSKAQSKPLITIYISDKTVTGEFTTYIKDRDTIVVNESEYKLSNSFKEANANGEELAKLNIIGENVLLYLDTYGYVAAVESADESALKYAYATKMSADGVFAAEVKIRVFDSDEVWRDYTLADKVKWNDVSEKSENVYSAICSSGKLTPQLIGYELNGDGKINRLETGVSSGNSDRLVRGDEVSGMYTGTNRSINWKVFFDDNTVVWIIPEEQDNESEYRIDNHTYFVHLEQHSAVPYNIDDYKFASMVTVEEGESYFNNTKDTGTMYVYLSSGDSLDENGNQVKMIECVGGSSGKAQYSVSEYCTVPQLEKGDAVKLQLNKNNVITNIERCFSVSEAGTEKVPSNFYTTELMAGYVKRVDYEGQRFTIECGGEQTLRNDLYSSGTTFIVNRNDGRGIIDTCGFSEIETGDYVVIRAQHSRLYDVYIIKNN